MGTLRLGVIAATVAFCAWSGWNQWSHRELTQPPGVLAPEEPRQTIPPLNPTPFQVGHYQITPLADYDITARILSRETYRFDRNSALSPIDFALGWGRMSDSAVLDKLSISQDSRRFYWYARDLPLPQDEMTSHAANVHLLPATPSVGDDLGRLRTGQVVTLIGRLVRVTGDDGFVWESSLQRGDSGDGSCEVFWVEKAFARRR